ncbi:NUDIX hydrolase [Streptomyces sp. NPDC051453]|uniref:NUDIX hydrolase n=1 Tax=Streptomyces sp. NPDC051453 TaxID=3154941 RepID=UPI0034453407
MITTSDLAPLAPLARVIADTVQETPVRMGTAAGATDLIQQLVIRTAAYMGSELPVTPGLARHMADLDAERQSQLGKFGDQHHPDGAGLPAWRDVLLEEVYEALAEKGPAALRAELVQVSAVCAAWITDLDSRPTP